MLGNTLSLSPQAASAASETYLAEDGTGWTLQAGRDTGPVPIRWFTQSDGLFCVTRALRGYPQPGECATYAFSGNRVQLTLDNGDTRTGETLPGDPHGLEARARGQAPQRLQGAEAARALVGNTLVLVATGSRQQHGAYHLMADGSGQWVQDEDSFGDYVGQAPIKAMRWRIDTQGHLCTAWPRGEDCQTVAITGDRVVLHLDATVFTGVLEAGDTRHLAPGAMQQSQQMLQAFTDATLTTAPAQQADARAYYLGADGQGQEIKRVQGQWTSTRTIQWMFRPDRRWLCISTLPPRSPPQFPASNCTPVALSGSKVSLAPEHGAAQSALLVKGKPSTKHP